MGQREKDQSGLKGNYQGDEGGNQRYSSSPPLLLLHRSASLPDSFLCFFQDTFFSSDAKKDY